MKSRATKSDQSSVVPARSTSVVVCSETGECNVASQSSSSPPPIVRDYNNAPMRLPLIRITLSPGSDMNVLTPEMVLKETDSPHQSSNIIATFMSDGCYNYRNVSDEPVTLKFKLVKYR